MNHQMITAFYIERLHLSTLVAATAISHIKRHSILMRIDTDLEKTNTQQLWEPEFLKSVLNFFY